MLFIYVKSSFKTALKESYGGFQNLCRLRLETKKLQYTYNPTSQEVKVIR